MAKKRAARKKKATRKTASKKSTAGKSSAKKTSVSQGSKGAAHMSFPDAAEHILRAERKALKYSSITKVALDKGLIQTESKTPEISMFVSLRADMKRREKRSEPQRFLFLGNGLFTLHELVMGVPTKKTQSAVEQVRQSRGEAGEDLYKRLTDKNEGPNFETMVADLLLKMGYDNVEVIGGKDDQGVDILCEKRDGINLNRIAVQCKCKSLSKKVGPKDVSTLRDNLSTYQCQEGVLVTLSELNEDARNKAKESGKDPIHFVEHSELLDLFAEHEIGLRGETVSYFQVDASQYEFLKPQR